MKKFSVASSVFQVLPDYCIGTVTAHGLDNCSICREAAEMLDVQSVSFAMQYKDVNVRNIPNIRAFRESFEVLGMNPNKYMCSIEALAKRVQKSGQLPRINTIVDLGNAFSLKYQLPMGAHDIDKLEADLAVRFSVQTDHFLGMGEEESQDIPEGELIYVSGHTVKTRRWIWRQSEDGKITEHTSNVFFPIDGFSSINRYQILEARDRLAEFLRDRLQCQVETGFVDANSRDFVIEP